MKWEKLGRIIDPRGLRDWMVTHAALPSVHPLEGTRYRVYCSGRNGEGKAQIGSFDFDLRQPKKPPVVSLRPVLTLGTLGSYEDSGLTNACLIMHQKQLYLYYTGWSLGETVPFYFDVGLAISADNGATFRKVADGPIMGRNWIDPYLVASPSIVVEGALWRMWYVSGARWVLENGQPKHYYHIRYAESDNGVQWRREGKVCIDFASREEYALGRPCVLKDGAVYKMWYSFRGDKYRIGYAESEDGFAWERKDDIAGITVSDSGWDSEMVEYPCVFDHQGTRYMLYNGNGYGETGIGLAVLSQDE